MENDGIIQKGLMMDNEGNAQDTVSEQNKSVDKDEVIEGYNPKVYKTLSILFIVLGMINIIAVIAAFSKTGYGLWHAENALSCIAKIDNSLNNINQYILEIELHPDDYHVLETNISAVLEEHYAIKENSDKFRELNLNDIDKTLSSEFEITINKVNNYYNAISDCLTLGGADQEQIKLLSSPDMKRMQDDASASLQAMFDKQDKSTYDFFYKVGKSFLLVLLFLILTMVCGLFAIHKAKKRDLEFAIKLQSNKQKIATARQKVFKMAYTNIVTGLKNRYALFEDLEKRINIDEFTITLYNFNDFKSIDEKYGRESTDNYMVVVSEKLMENFGDVAEIYSTDVDEFCLVFNDNIPRSKVNIISQKILYFLSRPVQIDNDNIQLSAAGCVCRCSMNKYLSVSDLFKDMDNNMGKTKDTCMQQDGSLLTIMQ